MWERMRRMEKGKVEKKMKMEEMKREMMKNPENGSAGLRDGHFGRGGWRGQRRQKVKCGR